MSILLIFVAVPFLTIDFYTSKYQEYTKYENSESMILGKISDYYKITKNGSVINKKEIDKTNKKETITLSEEGDYEISAYSYSEEGAKTTRWKSPCPPPFVAWK